jgi:hypothetical protein
MRVCNCRQGYETLRPASAKLCMRDGQWVEVWMCPSGCSAAQFAAREHVARQVLKDLARGEAAVDAESRLRFPDTTGS